MVLGRTLEKRTVLTGLPCLQIEKVTVLTTLLCLQKEWSLLISMALPRSICHSAMLASHLAGAAAVMVSRVHC